MSTQTTRRAVMAGLAAAPVAGLPAVAGAVSAAPMSDALAQAIERHKVAWAAFHAAAGDDEISRTCDAENDELMRLAETPCASDAEFIEKLRYLVDRHDGLWLGWADATQCPDILAAIRQHVGGESRS